MYQVVCSYYRQHLKEIHVLEHVIPRLNADTVTFY